MRKNTYTLEQLMLFDRCLFPESFAEDLMEAGLDRYSAKTIGRWVLRQRELGNMVGVLQIAQEWISDDEIQAAIDAVLNKFVAK